MYSNWYFTKLTLRIVLRALLVLIGIFLGKIEASGNSIVAPSIASEITITDHEVAYQKNSFLRDLSGYIQGFIPHNIQSYHPTPLDLNNHLQSPPLDGTFMQLATLPFQDIPAFMDEVHGLGMDTIIIQNIRTKESDCDGEECCVSRRFRWLPNLPAKLGLILDYAENFRMDIYIGLDLTSHGLCSQNFYEEPNASVTIEDTRKTIFLLTKRYGHHPALAGWYLPDEPSISEWIQPELAYDYYSGLVQCIKRMSSKPILVSPHLVGIHSWSPQEIAHRAYDFRYYTGVDILLWQDSAGADGAKLEWNPFSQSFRDYISAISALLGKDATWSVHEAFNCCVVSIEAIDGAAYRPSSLVRLLEQMNEVSKTQVAKKITWIQQHHFGSVDTTHHLEAIRLLDAYKARYGISGEYIMPESYYWSYDPDPQYDDFNFEMFNLRVGNPNDFTHKEWVGIDGKETGRAEVVIDLGQERTLEWVGFHLMSNPEAGIRFPTEFSLVCLSGSGSWIGMGSWHLPFNEQDMISEYLFSNFTPLKRDCRTFKASLIGNAWIFMSEVEIVVEGIEEIQSEVEAGKVHFLP